MWELWGVEISAFRLTWHIAYTTACCYRTSSDIIFHSEQQVLPVTQSMKDKVPYVANLMQNCVKYLRDEYRLSRMTGRFVLRWPMIELTYGLWSPTESTFCQDDWQQIRCIILNYSALKLTRCTNSDWCRGHYSKFFAKSL